MGPLDENFARGVDGLELGNETHEGMIVRGTGEDGEWVNFARYLFAGLWHRGWTYVSWEL